MGTERNRCRYREHRFFDSDWSHPPVFNVPLLPFKGKYLLFERQHHPNKSLGFGGRSPPLLARFTPNRTERLAPYAKV